MQTCYHLVNKKNLSKCSEMHIGWYWCDSTQSLALEKYMLSHFSHLLLLGTPWTVAHQAPLFMEFSKQEYWSGLPFPSPGDLPDPRIELRSPTLQAISLPPESFGKLLEKWPHPYYFVWHLKLPIWKSDFPRYCSHFPSFGKMYSLTLWWVMTHVLLFVGLTW